jgi:hypothetical protein
MLGLPSQDLPIERLGLRKLPGFMMADCRLKSLFNSRLRHTLAGSRNSTGFYANFTNEEQMTAS